MHRKGILILTTCSCLLAEVQMSDSVTEHICIHGPSQLLRLLLPHLHTLETKWFQFLFTGPLTIIIMVVKRWANVSRWLATLVPIVNVIKAAHPKHPPVNTQAVNGPCTW